MKFSYSMLLDFVHTELTPERAADLLTMAGFEVEGIEKVGEDAVLDIKVMSNRGDGLSVLGISREVLAKERSARPTKLYEAAANRFADSDVVESHSHAKQSIGGGTSVMSAIKVEISIETRECTRYACRLYSNVHAAEAPDWIQRRLRLAGMRPISLVVDLTNYVMLELGQPLHAFDFDRLSGGRIVVRQARPGERLTTLDGKEHELTSEHMMICDAQRPVAVAGVMGGLDTEVSNSTRTMLLESAHFQSGSVRRTRRQLGMATEASYRFERSVDPEGVVAAIRRFSALLAEAAPEAHVHPEVFDSYPLPLEREPIPLRMSRVSRLLGMEVDAEEARLYLEKLGFAAQLAADARLQEFIVVPPSWRPDVTREDDLVEEIGRIHGYERIPEALPHGGSTLGGSHGYEWVLDRLREAAVRVGYAEVVSHSFASAHSLDDPSFKAIGPRGIGDPEMATLRNSLLPQLARAARVNGAKDLHLFETGAVFGCNADGLPAEQMRMAFLSQGLLDPPDWADKQSRHADFFTLKAALEEVLALLPAGVRFMAQGAADPRFHPTRQAAVYVDGEQIGVIGQISQDAAETAGLAADTVIAEVELRRHLLTQIAKPHFSAISKNPGVRRDIAVLLDKSTPYESVERAVRTAAGQLLERSWLFDDYEGTGVPEGKRSLAIALLLRKMGENLTDEEANQVRERVVEALAALGATPR